MKLTPLFGFLILVQYCLPQRYGALVPVAYSPILGVKSDQLKSQYLQPIQINPSEYKWPSNASGDTYRTAIGNFESYFGLNTTSESVAYFITGKPPPRSTNTSSWLRLTPSLSDLAPIVESLSKMNPEVDDFVFISNTTSGCRQLREMTLSSFRWSVLVSGDASNLYAELTQLKLQIQGENIHYAICDEGNTSSFSILALNKLLQTGLYFGSDIYVYTNANVSDNKIRKIFDEFVYAGARLMVVVPALSAAALTPVEVSVKALEQFSINYVSDVGINLGGNVVPFTSPNFLRLVQTTEVTVPLPNGRDLKICFTADGFMCIISVSIYEVSANSSAPIVSGSYDQRTGALTLSSYAHHRPVVKLLAFQDTTFLPSVSDNQFSIAIQMLHEIFTNKVPYEYEIVQIPYSNKTTVQAAVEEYLSRSNTTMAMSAFPLPLSSDTGVKHTAGVLYDGIVMIKSRTDNQLALFRIFDSLSGYVWTCVFVSLVGVAIIFFIIKVVKDHQTRAMGFTPDDEGTSLFKRFFTVIFRNFSAVLLAKMIVEPKQTSIRVLYQSYWMASILVVATYAASLAEQRFVVHDTVVPFNSLRGLLNNEVNYRWIFLRNSSVVWEMQKSQDDVLKGLLGKAEQKWPKEMYAESVAEVSTRIAEDNHLIFIASRLEAKQILSEECGLAKVAPLGGKSGPVEYLYALGYFLSGNDDFVKTITTRVEALSVDNVFRAIEVRALGIGDCPLPSEEIRMQQKPFSLRELGGLFIIVLAGLVIAFLVAGIEFAIEKYPMYSQWKKGKSMRFGEAYTSEVLTIQDDGIWIRLLDNDTTAFVDSAHVRTLKRRRTQKLVESKESGAPTPDGRPDLQLGAFVKATYMGNDPHTTDPLFTVTEEKAMKRGNYDVVPPNNQPTSE